MAWDKFTASKELAERSMFVLLQNDVSPTRRPGDPETNSPEVVLQYFCLSSEHITSLDFVSNHKAAFSVFPCVAADEQVVSSGRWIDSVVWPLWS